MSCQSQSVSERPCRILGLIEGHESACPDRTLSSGVRLRATESPVGCRVDPGNSVTSTPHLSGVPRRRDFKSLTYRYCGSQIVDYPQLEPGFV